MGTVPDGGNHFYEDATSAPKTVFDVSLRPPAFSEFVGQQKVVDLITMRVEAAKQRGDVLDHVLLCGPPGLGKTSLAHIIAATVGSHIHTCTARRLKKRGISPPS